MEVNEPGEGNSHGAEAGTERPPIEPETPPEGAGVLANLPRTRPQRATARRAAARSADAAAAAAETTSSNGNGGAPRTSSRKAAASSAKRAAPAKPSRTKAAPAKRKPPAEDVPRQGYESVEERGATGPVQPPGGTELIGTAAEIVNEIAKAGISGGERLVRDVLSRLGR